MHIFRIINNDLAEFGGSRFVLIFLIVKTKMEIVKLNHVELVL